MRILVPFALLAAVGLYQSRSEFSLVVGGNHLYVSNVDQGGVDIGKPGDPNRHFSVTGEVAKVFSPEMGFASSGRKIQFWIVEQRSLPVVVKSGLIEGTAIVTFDSLTADKAAAENAAKAGTPAPKANPESHHTEIHSEKLTYSGTSEEGTLDIPQAWTLTDTTLGSGVQDIKGVQIPTTTEQTTEVTGTSGQLKIGKDKAGKLGKLQTGVIEGPVHFSIVRKETPKGATEPAVSRYVGVADRVTVDLTTTPGTLHATGHVVVDADSPEIKNAHFVEDEVIIELDDQMQPQRIRFGGHPAKTSVTQRGGGK